MSLVYRFLVVAGFLVSAWASAQNLDETAPRLLAAASRCASGGGHEYSLRGNLLENKMPQLGGTMVWRYRLDAINVELRTARNGEDQYLLLSCNSPDCMGYDTTSFKGTRQPHRPIPELGWYCPQTTDVVELHRQLTRYISALPKATPP